MKRRKIHMMVAIFIAALLSSGCGSVETYGERVSSRNITPIKDIVAHPEQYVGKSVTLEGKIDIECGTGCWFNLKEAPAVIYINLEPSGFAIPQKVGRSATVEGTVSAEEGKLTLTGKAVEIR